MSRPPLGQGGEAVGADIQGGIETLAGDSVHIAARKLIARGESHRVYDAIQTGPFFAEGVEGVFDLVIAAHIHVHADVGIHFGGEVLNHTFQAVALIRERQLRALPVHGLCHAPGDGASAGGADDKNLFVLHESHSFTLAR